jgi:DNA-binding NtrC family response regulator
MKNVLIVDDEETLLLIIESRFEDYKNQFKVLTACNGKEAIDILESHVVDFVITDLNMPILDGIELLAHMSAKFPTTPAIAMTAFSTPEVEEKLEKMGTLRIMDKPVDLDVLAHTVLDGLARSHQGGTLSCISVSNFLQLINMEEKTCLDFFIFTRVSFMMPLLVSLKARPHAMR